MRSGSGDVCEGVTGVESCRVARTGLSLLLKGFLEAKDLPQVVLSPQTVTLPLTVESSCCFHYLGFVVVDLSPQLVVHPLQVIDQVQLLVGGDLSAGRHSSDSPPLRPPLGVRPDYLLWLIFLLFPQLHHHLFSFPLPPQQTAPACSFRPPLKMPQQVPLVFFLDLLPPFERVVKRNVLPWRPGVPSLPDQLVVIPALLD